MQSQHNFIYYYFKELVDPVGTTTSKFVVTIELNKLAINLVISFTKLDQELHICNPSIC